MKTTIEVHADEFMHEIERMNRERASRQVFPLNECALCGSPEGLSLLKVASMKIEEPQEVPICDKCSGYLTDTPLEDYFRRVKNTEFFLWTKILTHNMRKDTWISRLTFEILRY